jgi:hypothetical protein
VSQQSAPERLARELPPDGVRPLLARLEELRRLGQAGAVGRIEADASGRLRLLVEYDWREEGA